MASKCKSCGRVWNWPGPVACCQTEVPAADCPGCNGMGHFADRSACQRCRGTGYVEAVQCGSCAGDGCEACGGGGNVPKDTHKSE
jgi:hypothetical protein